MATPQHPTIPGFTPDERSNCRATSFVSSAPNVAPLPSLVLNDGSAVLSRWQLTPQERLSAYLTGDAYVWTHTFGQPLQPLSMSFEPPAFETESSETDTLESETSEAKHVPQFGVLFDVLQERARQEESGGFKRYPTELWPAILNKHSGDFANAVIHSHLDEKDKPRLRGALVQLAAVTMAWIEAIDDPDGAGLPMQLGLTGEPDDILRRLVKSAGAASVIESLGKAARAESRHLSIMLTNLAHDHQKRKDAEEILKVKMKELSTLKRPMSIKDFNAELTRRFKIIAEAPLRPGESLLWIDEPVLASQIDLHALTVSLGGISLAGYAEDENDCDGQPVEELTLSAINAITSEFTIVREDTPRDFDFSDLTKGNDESL